MESIPLDIYKKIYPHSFASWASDGDFKEYEYIQVISEKVVDLIMAGGGKLIVEAPPRHGKSYFISQWLPTWFLETFPSKRVILATYAADFARDWGRKVRNAFLKNKKLNTTIDPTDSSAANWSTTAEGAMYTAGIGGPITGKGGDLIIIDDPVKNWDEASSSVLRERNKNWMKTTAMTRGEPGCVYIILMTRWHEQDLAGVMQEEDDSWEVLRFPAEAEEDDILGREVGEPLNPQRYGKKSLADRKKSLGSKFYAAMFQQRPSPEEGDIFKRQDWRYYAKAPEIHEFDKICMSWDMAFKKGKKSAYVVGQVWGRLGANFYLLDQVRDKMGFVESKKAVENLAEKHPYCNAILIEEKANGAAIIDSLKEKVSGIQPINPRGSKESRAHATSPLLEAGNLWLPQPTDRSFVGDFVEECSTFPNSNYKDQVDTMTQALDYLKGKSNTIELNAVGIFKGSEWGV